LTRRLVENLGGRYSCELGIDLEASPDAVDTWFLAATLFGTRISAATAMRTFRVLDRAGVRNVGDAGRRSWDELVELLDAGGYTRYDFRTATRLQELAVETQSRFGGTVSSLALISDPRLLEAALDALPGWGPTTVRIFLRELRDVWPGAQPPLDERALRAAQHLHIPISSRESEQVESLRSVARDSEVDARDLEAALVRLALAHHDLSSCPGKEECRILRRPHLGASL
jgi:hypothetical protein